MYTQHQKLCTTYSIKDYKDKYGELYLTFVSNHLALS